MKTVTIIVKDSETGTVQKFNAKLDLEHQCLKGVIGGVSVNANIYGWLMNSNNKNEVSLVGKKFEFKEAANDDE